MVSITPLTNRRMALLSKVKEILNDEHEYTSKYRINRDNRNQKIGIYGISDDLWWKPIVNEINKGITDEYQKLNIIKINTNDYIAESLTKNINLLIKHETHMLPYIDNVDGMFVLHVDVRNHLPPFLIYKILSSRWVSITEWVMNVYNSRYNNRCSCIPDEILGCEPIEDTRISDIISEYTEIVDTLGSMLDDHPEL